MKILMSRIIVIILLSATGFMSCGHGLPAHGKLSTISVSPAHAIITAGTNQRFTATAYFTDGTVLDWSSSVEWSTSESNAVTIGNELGSYGLVTSLGIGSTGAITITATDTANNISGTAVLIVTNTPLIDISVTPAFAVMSAGTSTQFTATGIYADGSTLNLSSFARWNSSDTSVAGVDSSGIVTARANGLATITATDPTTLISGSTSLEVE